MSFFNVIYANIDYTSHDRSQNSDISRSYNPCNANKYGDDEVNYMMIEESEPTMMIVDSLKAIPTPNTNNVSRTRKIRRTRGARADSKQHQPSNYMQSEASIVNSRMNMTRLNYK